MSYKFLKTSCFNNYFGNLDEFSTKNLKPDLNSRILNLLQINICSMNNLHKFDTLVSSMDSLLTDVHLLVISETWVNSLNVFSFNINNFTSIFSCRDDRRGGGLAIYIRNDISFKVICIDDGTFPFQFICVQLMEYNSTRVCAIYRPPGSDTENFLEFLEQMLNNHTQVASDFLLVGDINIAVNRISKLVSDYTNLIMSYGMCVTNTHITRSSSLNVLDHVVATFHNIDKIYNSTIFSDISDHNFVFTNILYKSKLVHKKLEKKILNYKKIHDF